MHRKPNYAASVGLVSLERARVQSRLGHRGVRFAHDAGAHSIGRDTEPALVVKREDSVEEPLDVPDADRRGERLGSSFGLGVLCVSVCIAGRVSRCGVVTGWLQIVC